MNPTPTNRPENDPRASGSTSRSLLVRARDNDSEAWDRLVELYAPFVFHWCRRAGLTDHDSADVFQDVFQAVAANIANFRKQRPSDTFRGWLRVITRNKVADFLRKECHQPHGVGGTEAQIRLQQLPSPNDHDAETDDEFESAEDDESARLQQELFHRALEMIRPEFHERTWRAFWRVVVDDCTPRDVAEELNMRPGTVRVCKSRVLRRLRDELGDLLD